MFKTSLLTYFHYFLFENLWKKEIFTFIKQPKVGDK